MGIGIADSLFSLPAKICRAAGAIALALLTVGLTSCDQLGGLRAWPEFTVVYHSNDGRGLAFSVTERHNAYHAILDNMHPDFAQNGLNFLGWATERGGDVVHSLYGGAAVSASGGGSGPGARLSGTAGSVVHLYAVWDGQVIVFDANGGPWTHSPMFLPASQTNATLLPLTKPWHSFLSWSENRDGSGVNFNANQPSQIDQLGRNVTLFARWEPRPHNEVQFTVTFAPNGGAWVGTDLPYLTGYADAGVQLRSGEGFSRDGYDFGGWSTAPNGGVFFPAGHAEPVLFAGPITLYARWIPESGNGGSTFAIHFDINGGTGTTPPPITQQGMYLPGGMGFSRDSHNFNGWSTRPDGDGGVFFPANHSIDVHFIGEITLYAVWTLTTGAPVTVSFDRNNGDGPYPYYRVGDTITGVMLPSGNAFTRTGYVFRGWNTRADGAGTFFPANYVVFFTGDRTLYAHWEPTFTVTFDINSGYGTIPPPMTQTEAAGATLPSGAGLSRPNRVFRGWNTMADGSGASFPAGFVFRHPGNITLFAHWDGQWIQLDNGVIIGFRGPGGNITIPTGIAHAIGPQAFMERQLDSVILPPGITSIGNAAFANNQLTSIDIQPGVTLIGDNAFLNNQLTSVCIPAGVVSIGNNAFQSNQLTSVYIPVSVVLIGSRAFMTNPLLSITIPAGVTVAQSTPNGDRWTLFREFYHSTGQRAGTYTWDVALGEWTFDGDITYSPESWFTLEPGNCPITNGRIITGVTPDAGSDIVIPSMVGGVPVTVIGAWAINTNITSVVIPPTVIRIENGAFMSNNLSSVVIPPSVTHIGTNAFESNRLTSISISTPSSLVEIGERAFATNRLTSVVIPPSVSTIGPEAFMGSSNYNALTSITVPANLTFSGSQSGRQNAMGHHGPAFYIFYTTTANRQAGRYEFVDGAWTGPHPIN